MQEIVMSLVIPIYNGQKFLETAIHSLISDQLIEENLMPFYEIIIINDGSTDQSLTKAKKIATKWNNKIRANFIKIIDKPNGQYGSVINRALQEARGTYLKILDCDDTLHTASLVDTLHIILALEEKVELILTDFTMEKVDINKKILLSLYRYFRPYQLLNLKKQHFPRDLMTMHAFIYQIDFLRKIKYHQVENVYYSDSQYALVPLAKVKSMYYLNLPLYRYYIGRNEQSINLKNMVKNREHQLLVCQNILKQINLKRIYAFNLKKYLILSMRRIIQWQIMLMSFDKNLKQKRKNIINFLEKVKKVQPHYYRKITSGSFLTILKITRGYGLLQLIKIGIILYAKFKTNILAEWD